MSNDTTTTVTVTRRSRCFGFGWTSQVEQAPAGLRIADPELTDTGLSLRGVLDECRSARSRAAGCDHAIWIFVKTPHGYRRVIGTHGGRDTRDVISDLEMLAAFEDSKPLDLTVVV